MLRAYVTIKSFILGGDKPNLTVRARLIGDRMRIPDLRNIYIYS
jgi:hypothetical protein